MTRRLFITFSLILLSVSVFGQSIPYNTLKTLQDCAKELRKIEGVTANVKLQHRNPADERAIELLLETPSGRSKIEVSKDGNFQLPELTTDDQGRSQVTHSLEKGALTLSFELLWNGKPPAGMTMKAESLFAFCSGMADLFRKFEHVFVKLGDEIPDFREFQIAIVGVTLPGERPSPGLAILKNGEKTVATVDLSQTGKVSWMFDDYDPKTHRVVWAMKNGEPEPKLFMEFKLGKEVAGFKRAILVRKVKPNGSEPVRAAPKNNGNKD